jgi:DNA-binding response OmpR family regulator
LVRTFIIANESEQLGKLSSRLVENGFACLVIPYSGKIIEQIVEQSPSTVLIDMDGLPVSSEIWDLPQRIKERRNIPVIALACQGMLDSLDSNLSIDDFVVKPWDLTEVIVRIKRVLSQTNNINGEEIIKCGALVIDLARYQVSVGGRLVTLTFREYQLLRFLASNQEKVFTREALLDKVWGWDYYGGDRTVDVHIRRLRSKIEDKDHSFIETIRNIGYRFREI